MCEFIGHTKVLENKTIEIQSLKDHLLNTQKYAEKYASDLSLSHMAGLAGLLHDIGKHQSAYKDYVIKSANAEKEGKKPKKGNVDHSSFGAMFLKKIIDEKFSKNSDRYEYRDFGLILENAIFSHHNFLGLKDYLNPDLKSPFVDRIERFESDPEKVKELKRCVRFFYHEVMPEEDLENYFQLAFKEYKKFIVDIQEKIKQSVENLDKNEQQSKQLKLDLQSKYFLSQYIYSCLLDADRTDATAFELDKSPQFKDNNKLFKAYYSELTSKIRKLNKNNNSEINKLRAEISEECDQAAEKTSGIYTLSASTGSGKTLSSLRYSLKHASLYHKKHIIYVLPYITIIEQNAEVMRKYLNNNKNNTHNILEFHSNVSQKIKDQKDEETTSVLDLTEDNWDSPIIVTTMVQFLDTIFAASTKFRRRFHNLCDSVIIFDEIQKVPIKCLDMFNEAVNFLKNFGASNILLCTATQPALDKVEQKIDLNKDHEIIPNLIEHEQQFKRVEFIDKTKNKDKTDVTLSSEEAADLIYQKSKDFKSILAIFNTIDVTRKIYSVLRNRLQSSGKQINIEYLSTNMCPADRKDRIKKVLNLVKEGKKVICISTPLIEAGVDASFECVFRSITGLDSLVQAAGRCNRNNELDVGKVYLINMDQEERISRLTEVKVGKDQVIELLHEGIQADDFLNANVIKKYFEMFYHRVEGSMSYPTNGIELENYIDGVKNAYELSQQNKRKDLSRLAQLTQFSGSETIAKNFQVIANNTKSVLAPYGQKGQDLIAALNGNQNIERLVKLIKKAQPYIVNLYENKFEQLFKEGDIYILCQIGNEAIYAFNDYAYNRLVLNDKNKGYIF